MRLLLLNVLTQLPASQDLINDLSTEVFRDLSFIRSDSFPATPPERRLKLLMHLNTYYQSSSDCGLQLSIDNVKCILLLGFTEDEIASCGLEFGGTVQIDHMSLKLQPTEPVQSNNKRHNMLNIRVFHDYEQPPDQTRLSRTAKDAKAQDSKASALKAQQQKYERQQYVLGGTVVPYHVLLSIAQEIAADWMRRDLYISHIRASRIDNISGRSLFLDVYPPTVSSMSDAYLTYLYDVKLHSDSLFRFYSTTVNALPLPDQSIIPVLVCAMVDAVVLHVKARKDSFIDPQKRALLDKARAIEAHAGLTLQQYDSPAELAGSFAGADINDAFSSESVSVCIKYGGAGSLTLENVNTLLPVSQCLFNENFLPVIHPSDHDTVEARLNTFSDLFKPTITHTLPSTSSETEQQTHGMSASSSILLSLPLLHTDSHKSLCDQSPNKASTNKNDTSADMIGVPIPSIHDGIQSSFSTLDFFHRTIFEKSHPLTKSYLLRAFSAYLKNRSLLHYVSKSIHFQRSLHELERCDSLTPRSVILRRSDLQELTRLFMMETGASLTASEAEDLIRRSVILHLLRIRNRDLPDKSEGRPSSAAPPSPDLFHATAASNHDAALCHEALRKDSPSSAIPPPLADKLALDITEPIDYESYLHDLSNYSIISLGSRDDDVANQMAVFGALSAEDIIPLDTRTLYEPLSNSICILQTPLPTNKAGVIVRTSENTNQVFLNKEVRTLAKEYFYNEAASLLQACGRPVDKACFFYAVAPSFSEWSDTLQNFLPDEYVDPSPCAQLLDTAELDTSRQGTAQTTSTADGVKKTAAQVRGKAKAVKADQPTGTPSHEKVWHFVSLVTQDHFAAFEEFYRGSCDQVGRQSAVSASSAAPPPFAKKASSRSQNQQSAIRGNAREAEPPSTEVETTGSVAPQQHSDNNFSPFRPKKSNPLLAFIDFIIEEKCRGYYRMIFNSGKTPQRDGSDDAAPHEDKPPGKRSFSHTRVDASHANGSLDRDDSVAISLYSEPLDWIYYNYGVTSPVIRQLGPIKVSNRALLCDVMEELLKKQPQPPSKDAKSANTLALPPPLDPLQIAEVSLELAIALFLITNYADEKAMVLLNALFDLPEYSEQNTPRVFSLPSLTGMALNLKVRNIYTIALTSLTANSMQPSHGIAYTGVDSVALSCSYLKTVTRSKDSFIVSELLDCLKNISLTLNPVPPDTKKGATKKELTQDPIALPFSPDVWQRILSSRFSMPCAPIRIDPRDITHVIQELVEPQESVESHDLRLAIKNSQHSDDSLITGRMTAGSGKEIIRETLDSPRETLCDSQQVSARPEPTKLLSSRKDTESCTTRAPGEPSSPQYLERRLYKYRKDISFRTYSDFYVATCDKSILFSSPLRNKITLLKSWAPLFNVPHGSFGPTQEFLDTITLVPDLPGNATDCSAGVRGVAFTGVPDLEPTVSLPTQARAQICFGDGSLGRAAGNTLSISSGAQTIDLSYEDFQPSKQMLSGLYTAFTAIPKVSINMSKKQLYHALLEKIAHHNSVVKANSGRVVARISMSDYISGSTAAKHADLRIILAICKLTGASRDTPDDLVLSVTENSLFTLTFNGAIIACLSNLFACPEALQCAEPLTVDVSEGKQITDYMHNSMVQLFGLLLQIQTSDNYTGTSGETAVRLVLVQQVQGLLTLAHVSFTPGYIDSDKYKSETGCIVLEVASLGVLLFKFCVTNTLIILPSNGSVLMKEDGFVYYLRRDSSFLSFFKVRSSLAETARVALLSEASLSSAQKVSAPPSRPTSAPKASRASSATKNKQAVKDPKKESPLAEEEAPHPSELSRPEDLLEEQHTCRFESSLLLFGGQGFPLWDAFFKKREKWLTRHKIRERVNFNANVKQGMRTELVSEHIDIKDPIAIVRSLCHDTVASYSLFPAFDSSTGPVLSAASLAFWRLHHELPLPMSDTHPAPLRGVYRILLGGHDSTRHILVDNTQHSLTSPFVPSVSVLDWVGNTIFVRLGASCTSELSYEEPATKPADITIPDKKAGAQPPGGKGKSSALSRAAQEIPPPAQGAPAPDQTTVLLTCQDTTGAILPAAKPQMLKTDMAAEFEAIVRNREAQALEQLRGQQTPAAEAQGPPPTDKRGARPKSRGGSTKRNASASAGGRQAAEEAAHAPVPLTLPSGPRELADILAERKPIVINTPFELCLCAFTDFAARAAELAVEQAVEQAAGHATKKRAGAASATGVAGVTTSPVPAHCRPLLVRYDDVQFVCPAIDGFKQLDTQNIPLPTSRLIEARFLVIPVNPDFQNTVRYDIATSCEGNIGNNQPWMCVSNREVDLLRYLSHVLEYAGSATFSYLERESYAKLVSIDRISRVPEFLGTLPYASVLWEMVMAVRGATVDARRLASPDSLLQGFGSAYLEVFDPTNAMFVHRPNPVLEYLELFDFVLGSTQENMAHLENVKARWKAAIQSREQMLDEYYNGPTMRHSDNKVLTMVRDHLRRERRTREKEREREAQRQRELDLQLQLQKIQSLQLNIQAVQDDAGEGYNYSIDKPSKRSRLTRINRSASKIPSLMPASIAPLTPTPRSARRDVDNDEDCEHDYRLSPETLLKRGHLYKHGIISGVRGYLDDKEATARVLSDSMRTKPPPVLSAALNPGSPIPITDVLRVLPAIVNMRQQDFVIVVKNRTSVALDVAVDFDRTLLQTDNVDSLHLVPGESSTVAFSVRHTEPTTIQFGCSYMGQDLISTVECVSKITELA